MMFRKTAAALLAATMLALPASAQQGEETAQGDVSVTIYQNGQSLVQDIRELNIARGTTRIEFPDVSAQIRPATLSFNADDTAIVEQNFDFDLLTPAKLMEKAIGRTVTLVRTNPATGAETRERAEVLSTVGGVVVRIGDRIEVLRDDGLPTRVVFDEVPPNLRARPTLSVTLNSSRSGMRDASIRYLTPGLGWTADYVALFDEQSGAVDMQGWVTLTNNTGTTFHQADTLLVAGDPARSRGAPNRQLRRDMVRPGTETADRERLGDFYLYPIDGRTTIANAQTKQVSFLDVQGVPARRVYTIGAGWQQNDDDFRPASSAISFNSSREGGLGDALPAGTVRFYQRDAQGNPQFIGENGIGHTPMGSTLSLRTGDAFDVYMKAEVEDRKRITAAEYEASERYRVIEDGEVVREVQVDRAVDYYRTTMRYTFTNAKPEPVVVELTQSGLGRYWWGWDYRVVSEDVEGEQLNHDNRLYRVSVPANGEREVRVTYETRY
ncbi:DUF4139 domain-containing protein [Aurantiacibacter rhizosphaerae]|uniref:DUF4139 domain-containing protein n=1 Tax=Aurantiacibacter rhizosphaerae TaxID=2691582 RepID=A0A844XF03_9SPHN|nr:DUF4139 domain-containing protein [Aurantiacibacter rhizosphaerae]MWV28333.1 DUF4139 domain-containing protein [Aurantiacibacter rhizosphaerae]